MFLAAPPKRPEPVPDEPLAEGAERLDVVGHRVIAVVPAQNAGEPAPCSGMGRCIRLAISRLTASSLARIRFESVSRRSLNRPVFLVFPQMCVKPRNWNVSGLPSPRACTVAGGVPPELDQPRLLGIQFQTELREPVAKLSPEPLGVLPMLKPHHEVISPTHDDHITAARAGASTGGPRGQGRSARRRSRATEKPKLLAERLPRTPSMTRSR